VKATECINRQQEAGTLKALNDLAKLNGKKTRREKSMMKSRREVVRSISVVFALFTSGGLAFARSRRDPLYGLDTDNDGSVDLEEAKRAASALFDRLDRDHDGTLDRRELRGRLSARELDDADPDHDGTLTKSEYLAVVEKRFNAANPDRDGTLDSKEIKTKAGQALLKLLR
jgi:EF hand